MEVKTLRSKKPGHPADRVDREKQRQLSRLALRYLKRNGLLDVKSRFDVIAIYWPGRTRKPTKVRHFISAFDSVGDYQFFV